MGRALHFIDGVQIGASVLTGHISNLVRIIFNSNITAIRFFLMMASSVTNTTQILVAVVTVGFRHLLSQR